MFLLRRLSCHSSIIMSSSKCFSSSNRSLQNQFNLSGVNSRTKNSFRKIVQNLASDTVVEKIPTIIEDMQTQALLKDVQRKQSIEELSKYMKSLSNEDLVRITKALVQSEELAENKLNVWFDEVLRRVKTLNKNQLLSCADAVYLSRHVNQNTFFSRMMYQFIKRWGDIELTPANVLQLCFSVCVDQFQFQAQLLSLIEDFLATSDCISSYSLEELALVCSAFSSSNTSIKNVEVLERIGNKVLNELKNQVDTSLLICIIKILKLSYYDDICFYENLAKSLCKHQDLYFKGNSSQNISFIGYICQVYGTTKIAADEMFGVIRDVISKPAFYRLKIRAKDIGLIMESFGHLGYSLPQPVIEHAVNLWRNNGRRNLENPELFIEAVYWFLVFGGNVEDLVSLALSPRLLKIQQNRPGDKYQDQIAIDTAAALLLSNYSGHRLPKEFIDNPPTRLRRNLNAELKLRKGVTSVVCGLRELLGQADMVDFTHLSPSSSLPDIVLEIDEDGKPQPMASVFMPKLTIEQELSKADKHSDSIIKKLLKEHHLISRGVQNTKIFESKLKEDTGFKKISIQVLGVSQMLSNKLQLRRIHLFNINLLNLQGYTVLILYPEFASELYVADRERRLELMAENIIKPLGIKVLGQTYEICQ